jgi:hypothetical protein
MRLGFPVQTRGWIYFVFLLKEHTCITPNSDQRGEPAERLGAIPPQGTDLATEKGALL